MYIIIENYLLDVRVWISLHQVPIRNLIVRGSLKTDIMSLSKVEKSSTEVTHFF